MNLYETTFIINPQTDDATIDRHVREVADLITRNQGKIQYEDHMGTRRLAYEINGLTQGYYASFIFEAPVSVLPVLQRHYMLNESYIRHLTVRFEGDLSQLVGAPEGDTKEPEKSEPTAHEPAAAEPEVTEETPKDTAAETEQAEGGTSGDEPAAADEPDKVQPAPEEDQEDEL
ncbi:MAG: 30S ribosomal protein S6 [Candidatus Zixiibacteriota bacterium]|nr:MAG: 30S ribosomal protein S6 [candidate division Zixibacteria bacterium]